MKINGIAASDGIAIAKVYKLNPAVFTVEKIQVSDSDKEIKKLEDAIAVSVKELEVIRDKTLETIDQEHADIFNAHIQILKDPELFEAVKGKVHSEKVNIDFALKEVTDQFIDIFLAMDNDYMRERVSDIEDVTKRLLGNLQEVKADHALLLHEEAIIVANDLTPSDTAQLDKKYVKGFVTNVGGCTSHSAIIARTMEIPAVVGAQSIFDAADAGDLMIIDGTLGEVILKPTKEELETYRKKALEYAHKKTTWQKYKDKPSKSVDGHLVELAANIASSDDVASVLTNGGEGIGLFRTEFLYMGKETLPTEDEQFEAYKKVLEAMKGKPVVIRTLDIGGDKEVTSLDLPKEMNPFLGYRAIRLCLDQVGLFKTQLRALLRASVFGNLKIMFPMIATVNEFLNAKNILLEAKDELLKEGTAVSNAIEIGIMVEIPSAAILADQFAKEVDFFSIGTNDLIQYTFAADRMNERVAYLYQPYNPSLLRLIKMVIDAAHKEGKWTGMCGEMAGNLTAIPILLGLGLDEFSMSATSILPARHLISQLSKKEMSDLANKALNMRSNEEVMALVHLHMKEVNRC